MTRWWKIVLRTGASLYRSKFSSWGECPSVIYYSHIVVFSSVKKRSCKIKHRPWLRTVCLWSILLATFAASITKTGPDLIKLCLSSTQLSIKFIMLINVKMPTIVGILTFISMINKISESLKARKVFSFQHFSFYSVLCSVELSMKNVL